MNSGVLLKLDRQEVELLRRFSRLKRATKVALSSLWEECALEVRYGSGREVDECKDGELRSIVIHDDGTVSTTVHLGRVFKRTLGSNDFTTGSGFADYIQTLLNDRKGISEERRLLSPTTVKGDYDS